MLNKENIHLDKQLLDKESLAEAMDRLAYINLWHTTSEISKQPNMWAGRDLHSDFTLNEGTYGP